MNFYDLTRHRLKVYWTGQIMRVMRLTVIIMTTMLIQVSAKSIAQKVTLSERNTPLLQIFNQLSSQTGYDFFYSEETLKMARSVTINVKNQPLNEVLELIFKNQNLAYFLKNKAVIIAKKEASFLEGLQRYLLR